MIQTSTDREANQCFKSDVLLLGCLTLLLGLTCIVLLRLFWLFDNMHYFKHGCVFARGLTATRLLR